MSANSSPGKSTFDVTTGSGPYRPGTADFNGAVKVDDTDDPPDGQTMPNAEEWNTISLLLVALGKVAAQVTVSVKQAAGVYSFDLTSAAGSAVVPGANLIELLKNGTGDVTVKVATSLLANGPGGQAFRPKVTLNEDQPYMIRAIEFSGLMLDGVTACRGARVKIVDNTNTAQNGGFTVDIG